MKSMSIIEELRNETVKSMTSVHDDVENNDDVQMDDEFEESDIVDSLDGGSGDGMIESFGETDAGLGKSRKSMRKSRKSRNTLSKTQKLTDDDISLANKDTIKSKQTMGNKDKSPE